ncbi:hypothetical protein [Streptomyces sp. NPDC056549]|uniref:hypothetical protein n=1 Tax=Streptomyces sp. NPDC056549 TaxID=3345864 RepID=UPI0036A61FA9
MLAAITVAGAVACGAEDDPKPDGQLSAALAGITEDASGGYLAYWNVQESKRLIGKDKELYGVLDGFGIAEVLQSRNEDEPLRTARGFDENDVETAVQIAPQAARLTGRFDVKAAAAALRNRGWTEQKTDGGTLFDDGDAQVAVAATVRSSSFGQGGNLPPLSPPEHSLVDDPAYQAVLRCVGEDTYHATFYGKTPENGLSGLILFAIGAHTRPDGSSRERLCALTESGKSARIVTDALMTKTSKGERFAGATVKADGGRTPMVTMEWANSTASGLKPGAQRQTGELVRLLTPPR